MVGSGSAAVIVTVSGETTRPAREQRRLCQQEQAAQVRSLRHNIVRVRPTKTNQ